MIDHWFGHGARSDRHPRRRCRRHRLHRSRALPRRARHVRQARLADLEGARSRAADDPVAWCTGRALVGAHDHGRSARHAVRHVRDRARAPHPRFVARAAVGRRGGFRARAPAGGLLEPPRVRDRPGAHVRPLPRRRRLPARDVVESLVVDADLARRSAVPLPTARHASDAGVDARVDGTGDPSTVLPRRPAAVLGVRNADRRPSSLRRRRCRPKPTTPSDRAAETEAIDVLRHALEAIEAPAHQFERLGIG